MDVSTEIDVMKDGARRMQEFFAANNVEIKHSLMLEALSSGFGARNWRTVRDKLNQPAAAPLPTPEKLNGCRWTVHAIYSDNNQPYGDYFPGETAMEAAIIAQVEALISQDGGEIIVSSVIDRITNEIGDHERGAASSALERHSSAVYKLSQLARENLAKSNIQRQFFIGETPLVFVALDIFDELLAPKKDGLSIQAKALDDISGWTRDESDFEPGLSLELEIDGEDRCYKASDLLRALVDFVRKDILSGQDDELKKLVYQASALLDYAEDEVNYALS